MNNAERVLAVAQQLDRLIAEISLAADVVDIFGFAQRADEMIAALPPSDREILLERLDDAIGERMEREGEIQP
jgi:hypothetical protein